MNKKSIWIWAVAFIVVFSCHATLMAQPHCARKLTSEAQMWLQRLYEAAEENKPYYSQFDQYPARSQHTLQSTYTRKTGVDLLVYGLDFSMLRVLGLHQLIKKSVEVI